MARRTRYLRSQSYWYLRRRRRLLAGDGGIVTSPYVAALKFNDARNSMYAGQLT